MRKGRRPAGRAASPGAIFFAPVTGFWNILDWKHAK